VKDWYGEVRDFTYSGNNQFQATGHYTQLVWATSNKVGCGVASCKDSQGRFYNYVCNYCPT
jgi:Cysteine-rich secretory protein family